MLLLLADEPGYGYRLVKELEGFRFGAIDRPSVYRTLGQLERDGLVVSWADDAKSAQSRRLYRLTPQGQRALRVWMGVIKEERDRLDAVLRRYAASGGVRRRPGSSRGRMGRRRGPSLSSVSPTTEPSVRPTSGLGSATCCRSPSRRRTAHPARFAVVPDRSAVLVEARSTVGPLTFGVMGLTGEIGTQVADGVVCADERTTATVLIPTEGLRSGNAIYDAELSRRIDARRYPVVTLALHDCVPSGVPDRYRVGSDVTIHGVTGRWRGP